MSATSSSLLAARSSLDQGRCQSGRGCIIHGDMKIAVMLNPEAQGHEFVHSPDDRASVVA